ncbi:hypothetical protein [Nannocystis radixulma]|uniref:Myxococcus cysteine-rich repeat-containing protein n=1 Tax=Nannocystis radixulma TaxID=2995305 RepID=A0ABT5B425_9BACT|nr:hypothetical protein [Nannocystis radixulma]MDC0668854.1 hypothetical protein [Nannocystis radixulma]
MTSLLCLKGISHRAVVLVSVGLSGCVLDYQVGENPQELASDDSGSSSPTTTTGPAVCGDGSVDGDEACDDGNDVADDGCDLECRPSANVEWTRKDRDADVVAVDVDPAGRIVLAGWENNEALVRVLNPDGALAWERKVLTSGFDYATFHDVVVAGDGRIFATGHENVPYDAELLIQGFGPDGEALWTAHESFFSNAADAPVLAVGPGGLYVANSALQPDETRPLIVRRLDPATGAVQWNIHHGDALLTASDLAVSGSAIVAVGSISETEDDPRHPLVVVLDEQGAVVSSASDLQVDGNWFSVAPIGDAGDLLLAGLDASIDINGYGAVLRRVRADGTEVWSFIDEETTEQFLDVAVGPDEAIVVIGTGRVPDSPVIYGYTRRLTGQGESVWSSHFLNTAEATQEQGYAAAFGPGFIVALGQWNEGPIADEVDNWATWVRRLSSE